MAGPPQESGRGPDGVGLVVAVGRPSGRWPVAVGHAAGEADVEVGRAAHAPGRAEDDAVTVGQAGDVVVAAALDVAPAAGEGAEAAAARGGEVGATGLSGTMSTPRA